MKYLLTDSVKHLKITGLKIERKFFPDGELYFRIKENIKDEEVTIISNITPINLPEFLFIVDAAKRAGGKIKEIIIPYISYARQGNIYNYGEALSGVVIFNIISSLKIPVRIFDVHNESLREYLDFNNENILLELAKYLPKNDFVVISPDEGGLKRAFAVAKSLRAEVLMIKKERQGQKIIMDFSNNLIGKKVLIVDDIISTGATLIAAYKILKKNKAGDIYCIATHGLFVKNALKNLGKTNIKKIIVSNTLPVKKSKMIKVVKIEKFLLGIKTD